MSETKKQIGSVRQRKLALLEGFGIGHPSCEEVLDALDGVDRAERRRAWRAAASNRVRDLGRTEEEVRQGDHRGDNGDGSFGTFEPTSAPTPAATDAPESGSFDGPSAPLSFDHLRDVSLARCRRWMGPRGPSEWSLSDWGVATAGELSEALNVVKKLNRTRDGLIGNRVGRTELKQMLADELADTLIYLDIMAAAAGIYLEAAVRSKFNRTSEKHGFPERL